MLRHAVFDELAAIAAHGVDVRYLQKVSEQLRRQRESELRDNDFWAGWLYTTYLANEALTPNDDLTAILARATSDGVRAIAARMFDPENYELVVLEPAAKGDPAAEHPAPAEPQAPGDESAP